MLMETDPPVLALAMIAGNLTSPNELDRNGEPANVVDGLYAIARALHHVADAITQTTAATVAADSERTTT